MFDWTLYLTALVDFSFLKRLLIGEWLHEDSKRFALLHR
jgi:hypothetical protein